MSAAIEEYHVANAGAGPYGITTGPDGALWFSLIHAGHIARRSADGELVVHQLDPPTCRPSLIITWGRWRAVVHRITEQPDHSNHNHR